MVQFYGRFHPNQEPQNLARSSSSRRRKVCAKVKLVVGHRSVLDHIVYSPIREGLCPGCSIGPGPLHVMSKLLKRGCWVFLCVLASCPWCGGIVSKFDTQGLAEICLFLVYLLFLKGKYLCIQCRSQSIRYGFGGNFPYVV